jgi:Xaa-Pro aminopeptidase
MKYEAIDNKLFVQNRQNLAKLLKNNHLAVFNSNDIMPTSADGTMKFKQQSDIFYLSGIDQEESILVIFPDSKEEKHKEILFLRETSEHIAVWEGHKYTKEEATQASGIKTVYWLTQFKSIFYQLTCECEGMYLNHNEHLRATIDTETRDMRFIRMVKETYPLHRLERAQPLMHHLRAIKSAIEVSLLRKACEITERGFRRVLSFVRHDVMEYEIEAEFIHEFIRNRSTGFAYTPIIASGKNSCVLHYLENNQRCIAGDLVLMDVAAEYANYAADLTRTIPISGRFSARQRQVYDAVLRVKRQATTMLVVGNNWVDYHKEVGKIMESELIQLGLLDRHEVSRQDEEKPLYKKYFMHGTSHHLGLDVHDYGSKFRTFEAGMVFTCEPGIYIPAENFGIRLENDILITPTGNIDLMASVPIEAEEIEELMNQS